MDFSKLLKRIEKFSQSMSLEDWQKTYPNLQPTSNGFKSVLDSLPKATEEWQKDHPLKKDKSNYKPQQALTPRLTSQPEWMKFKSTWNSLPEKDDVYHMLFMQNFYQPTGHGDMIWGPKLHKAVVDYCKQHQYPASGDPSTPQLVKDAVSYTDPLDHKNIVSKTYNPSAPMQPGHSNFPTGSTSATPGADSAGQPSNVSLKTSMKKINHLLKMFC